MTIASTRLVAALLLAAAVSDVNGHARFHCPAPRTSQSGVKEGSCGPYPKGNIGAELTPGIQTIHFEETIVHTGAPYRIALSVNGDDNFEDCILLNHIPNAGATTPAFYSINVEIPDIDCPSCTLQLIQVMTDKIADPTCTFDPLNTMTFEGGRCGSNYFSCADVAIKGTVPVSQFTCPQQPADWPYRAKPKYTYERGNLATWTASGVTNLLNTLPQKYTSLTGFCSQDANLPGKEVNYPGGGSAGGGSGGNTGGNTGGGGSTGGTSGGTTPTGTEASSGGEDTGLIIGIAAGAGVLIIGGALYSQRNRNAAGNQNNMSVYPGQQYQPNGKGWGNDQSHYFNESDPNGHMPPPRGPPPI